MNFTDTIERLRAEGFPLLYGLGLSNDELDTLTRQGSVSCETRGSKTIYRLRFRVHGRQCVRYVSPSDAAPLKAELAMLQRRKRAHQRLVRFATLARQLLRQRKAALTPWLEARGYKFHGIQIRRSRTDK
jgi:hypothetical protein